MDPRASRYRLGAAQTVSIGAASAASTAFGAGTFAVRIVSTSACHVAVGANPAAIATDAYLPADRVEYITVKPGEKIAVIQDTAAGTLSITELS